MKVRFGLLSRFGLSVSLFAILMIAGEASAQSSDGQGIAAALTGAVLLFFLVFVLAVYIYMALALQTIAVKTSTANAWLAWIPLVNVFLMLSVAKKPMWWFLLFLIPAVNLVFVVLVWMAIAEARRKPNWWGILMIAPVVNMVVPGYLAWSD